ncbi:cytochrome c oxidase subunit [Cystoisospora suis]|uniref:Cytochrome c oxidase subunit n=1 Tax=Cystoisospora suis TaxID=483139 RepID=A0A2C6L9Y2_9APIC|nr:cytochrome c oxidase subunit [Cystoisospora suis]
MLVASYFARPLRPALHQLLGRRLSPSMGPVNALSLRHFSSTPPPSLAKPGSHPPSDHHDDHRPNFYHMPVHHHGDPRHHLDPDGTMRPMTTAETFHWENEAGDTPPQQIVSIDGRKMVKGIETRDFVELFQIHQKNMPFWPRTRLNVWGNYDLLMKAEFLFFWIPTFIIWSLAVPMFTMLYMYDEAVYSAMTVKVIGRQWYWIYEVESPVDDDEEE